MSRKKDEKQMEEVISRTINSGRPEFDAEKWKQKYPEEFQMLQSMSEGKTQIRRLSIWRVFCQSPITKIAAAAVIIVGIGLHAVLVHQGPGEPRVPKVVKSPTKMMTAMSLTMAYRRGGIDAVDEQCEKAIRMLGPRPLHLTLGQLLAENNG
ncbi:MAG: hypothetical protein ACYS32_16515 [Planctomycetota bacterium]|jgi:hypothetical protein